MLIEVPLYLEKRKLFFNMAKGGPSIIENQVSGDEEEKYLDDRLDAIGEILALLKEKGETLPPRAKEKYQRLKKVWAEQLKEDDLEQNGGDVCNRETAGHRGAVPKDSKLLLLQKKEKGSLMRSRGRLMEDEGGSSEKTECSESEGVGSSLYRSIDQSSSTSGNISSIDSDDVKPEIKPRRRQVRSRKREKSQMEQLIEVVSEKLDTRKVPSQEKFDDDGGEDLIKYLSKFENYCKSNYKGDKSLWIGELERHLTGKVLGAFRAMKDADDTYDVAKKKLVEWYIDLDDLRKQKNRNRFKNAKYVKGEPLYLYSNRLEKLFKLAYPKSKIDSSRTLQEKFISTIPKASRKLISTQVMGCKVKDQKVTWKMVQKCSRLYDAEAEKEKIQSGSEEKIIINIRQHADMGNNQVGKSFFVGSPRFGSRGGSNFQDKDHRFHQSRDHRFIKVGCRLMVKLVVLITRLR